MATEIKPKIIRKKSIKPKVAEISAPVNKHLMKINKLSKLGFLPALAINIVNKSEYPIIENIENVGKFLDKHCLMYFDIPTLEAQDIVFPETSKDFLPLFFTLNKKYATKFVNQDGMVGANRYRSLGEIYLTFKFYYAKITWKLFLKTFFSAMSEEAKVGLTQDSLLLISNKYLSSLVCGAVNRRIFTIRKYSGRSLSYIHGQNSKDEFGFKLQDYLDYIQ